MTRLGRLIAEHRVAMLAISGPEVAFTDALHEQLGNVGGQNLIAVRYRTFLQRAAEPIVVGASTSLR